MNDVSGLFLGDAGGTFRLVLYLCLVMLAVLVLGFGLKYLRRRFHTSRPERPTDPGFTMGDLEWLREAGELTDEEFRRLRARVLEAATRMPQSETAVGDDSSLRPVAAHDDEQEAGGGNALGREDDEKDA